MTKKAEKIRQYFINGLNIDEIIDYHIERKQPIDNVSESPFAEYYMEEEKGKKVRKGQVLKNKRLPLYHKIVYLIHLIACRCTNNENGITNLNASALQKLVGNDYQEILLTLQEKEIITINEMYLVEKYSKSYAIHQNYYNKISTIETLNPKLIKYNNKAIKLIKEYGKHNKGEI
ncbi:hypothetical protein D0T84_22240 [Dysgonomonas sp. 521]|uniref:hypothetical protein n=1 Tax=Dysgonomonas sp. 521 TaxID=2302932 RepID=UPI0013D25B3E|nr:hypothetical protein [Dysgonomonas sp. 521]NDV97581.1 hypothetical protein [Dysgonomonas sp. 521]